MELLEKILARSTNDLGGNYFYANQQQEDDTWDAIYHLFNQLEYDWWEDETTSINLLKSPTAEGNLLQRLTNCEYPVFAVALLKACRFNLDFQCVNFPRWPQVEDLCSKLGINPQLTVELCADITDYRDCSGIQFAEYNIETSELIYTHYYVRAVGMYNRIHGKGKAPLTSDGELIQEKFIQMD